MNIATLSKTELEQILSNEDKINEYALSSDSVKSLQAQRDQVCQSNRTLANENLAFQPGLEDERKSLAALYQKLDMLEKEYQAKQQQLQSKRDTYSLDSAAAVLQAAASEADEESEDLARSFVNGEVEIQQFRKEFPDARTKAHQLRLKAEKMLAQSQQQHQRSQITQQSAPPAYAAPYRPAPQPPSQVRPPHYQQSAFPAYPPQQPRY